MYTQWLLLCEGDIKISQFSTVTQNVFKGSVTSILLITFPFIISLQ